MYYGVPKPMIDAACAILLWLCASGFGAAALMTAVDFLQEERGAKDPGLLSMSLIFVLLAVGAVAWGMRLWPYGGLR